MRIIRDTEDVTPEVLEAAEDVWEGWFADEPRIQWEDFIDRLARYGETASPPYDFEEYDSPAVRKIQRHVRALTD